MGNPANTGAARSPEDRLDSWKEIAGYLRRGARTVQRWEREQGLPVHRLVHDQGSTVYAYKSELDSWWVERGSSADRAVPAEADTAQCSVAVLPFRDMSREQDQGYLCEGLAEEIINTLTRLRRIRVASRTASFPFRDTEDIHEIGRRLRVGTLLEGSVRKSGQRLRVCVQVMQIDSGYQLWGEHYERDLTDIFAVEDEIAQNVAAALSLTLTPEERGALYRKGTRILEAYDFYLRGRAAYFRYSRREVEAAIQLYSQAAEIDPEYADAHSGIADCWCYLYLYAQRSEANLARADAASRCAVDLDPANAHAQASRAVALSLLRKDSEAESAFEIALRLDPSSFEAHYFYARHAFVLGELAKAVRLYEEAMRVRPDDYQSPLLVAQSYEVLGRPEQARVCRERGVQAAEQHLLTAPDDARAVYMAANGLAALGDKERGREWAKRALRMEPDDSMVLYNVGCVFSLVGDTERAIDCLEQAVEKGLTQKGWLEHDGNLDPLRGDPRFQRLIESL